MSMVERRLAELLFEQSFRHGALRSNVPQDRRTGLFWPLLGTFAAVSILAGAGMSLDGVAN